MSHEYWIWMPHAGHSRHTGWCKFKLNTHVNGYIVSTVGEYQLPELSARNLLKFKINNTFCSEEEKTIFKKILATEGEEFRNLYLHFLGYEKIGHNTTYETKIFKAKENEDEEHLCCPYLADTTQEFEHKGYNDPVSATKGHYEFCEKYDKIEV